MITLSLEHSIQCAHQLPDTPQLLTKKCATPHGHSYQFKISADFEKVIDNCMTVDVALIKQVLDKYDHQDLNTFFNPTTAEHFAVRIAEELFIEISKMNDSIQTVKVSISETGKAWFTVEYGK